LWAPVCDEEVLLCACGERWQALSAGRPRRCTTAGLQLVS
jgi:hypothetical protein